MDGAPGAASLCRPARGPDRPGGGVPVGRRATLVASGDATGGPGARLRVAGRGRHTEAVERAGGQRPGRAVLLSRRHDPGLHRRELSFPRHEGGVRGSGGTTGRHQRRSGGEAEAVLRQAFVRLSPPVRSRWCGRHPVRGAAAVHGAVADQADHLRDRPGPRGHRRDQERSPHERARRSGPRRARSNRRRGSPSRPEAAPGPATVPDRARLRCEAVAMDPERVERPG